MQPRIASRFASLALLVRGLCISVGHCHDRPPPRLTNMTFLAATTPAFTITARNLPAYQNNLLRQLETKTPRLVKTASPSSSSSSSSSSLFLLRKISRISIRERQTFTALTDIISDGTRGSYVCQ